MCVLWCYKDHSENLAVKRNELYWIPFSTRTTLFSGLIEYLPDTDSILQEFFSDIFFYVSLLLLTNNFLSDIILPTKQQKPYFFPSIFPLLFPFTLVDFLRNKVIYVIINNYVFVDKVFWQQYSSILDHFKKMPFCKHVCRITISVAQNNNKK